MPDKNKPEAGRITDEMVNAILFDIGTHDPCDEEMEETICRNILRAALAAGWLPPPTEDEPERVKAALWNRTTKRIPSAELHNMTTDAIAAIRGEGK